MENRIKARNLTCQADLFSDRTSTATMKANQLRLWFASMALSPHLTPCAGSGLQTLEFANASCGTLRLKLLKALARVLVPVRRIRFAMASGHPRTEEWGQAHRRQMRRLRAPASPFPSTTQIRKSLPATARPRR